MLSFVIESWGRFVFEKKKNEREFSLSLTLARLLVDNSRLDVIHIYIAGLGSFNRCASFFLALLFLFFSSRRNLYFTEVWHDHTFHMTVAGSQAHAHVTGLRPAVSYQFRIYAENELGRSQASDVSIPRFNTMSSLSLSLSTRHPFHPIPRGASIYTRDRYSSLKAPLPRIAIFSPVEFHPVRGGNRLARD